MVSKNSNLSKIPEGSFVYTREETMTHTRTARAMAIICMIALIVGIFVSVPDYATADSKTTVQYSPLRYVDVECDTVFKSGSGETYSTIGTVPKGARIYSYGYDRYDANTAWYKVSYNGQSGYIDADDCHLSYQAYSPAKTGKTTANMYIRSGVGLDYTKKKYIKSGSTLTLQGYYRTEGYDWYKIKSGSTTGYVSSKYVKRIEVPEATVDCGNLSATVSWDKLSGAYKYKVYRKIGPNGSFRLLGETKDNTYTDVYVKTAKTDAEKSYLCAGYFVDPSINPYVYTVRACYKDGSKEILSGYSTDGTFHIETPSIVSVNKSSATKATIEWSTLKNAKSYLLYSGYMDSSGRHWTKLKEVTHKSGTRQKETVSVNAEHTYFTVKAKFTKDGKTIYSDYDKGFTLENKVYSDKSILYIGNSITFGSPYKGKNTVEVFSYPWRVQQLTGADMYNPSIPGATYAYKSGGSRDRLVEDVAVPMNEGRTPVKALHSNTRTYEDFDVVVMAGGTNDYADDISPGTLDSTDRTEFNGAINEIMGYIKAASDERVKQGKDPIKVVFVDLFYSNRLYDYTKLTNRFITPNKIGLTLTDYQRDLDQMVEKYRQEGIDIYQFHTAQFVDENTCAKKTSDNLHMSRYTYTQIGNELARFLVTNGIL